MKSDQIWVDASVNESLWSKGKFTIPSRIRVRATRFSDGVVEVTLPEAASTGSIRTQLADRREKAAEKAILKAPEADEEGDDGDDGHGHSHGGKDGRPVTDVKGIGPTIGEKLEKAGIKTLHDLAHSDPAEVTEAAGASVDKAKGWIKDAHDILDGKTEVADVKSQPALEADKADKAKAEKAKPAKKE
jgi:predicted flap endonuclease-1-like 5' DNA nuclease